MIKNADFNGSVDTNPYEFRQCDMSEFSLYVYGKRVPSKGISLDMDHERNYAMVYRTHIEGSGIHHSNSGLQITHDMYINCYLMSLYDLTANRVASESHTSLPENDNIRIELLFSKPLPLSITCLL